VTTIVRGLGARADRRRSLAIGTFDGVHAGHRATIERAMSLARERGLTSSVLTFDRHPLALIRPEQAPQLLTSPEERIHLIAELGPDEVVILPFDDELVALSAERFCADILFSSLGAEAVVVGQNFNFGAGGKGDAVTLRRCGLQCGFETIVLRLTSEHGDVISSTRIRHLLRAGAVEAAREMLGRPPSATGVVVRGEGRGMALGVPTANLAVSPHLIRPGLGVYVARASVGGAWFRAAVNVGHNPTFHGAPESVPPVNVEAHLLAFDGDLYGREVRVEFLRKIRDERAFDSIGALVVAIRHDIEIAAAMDDEAFAAVGLPAVATT
jgi:riboflavin kinase/FMN adenylyltransferase